MLGVTAGVHPSSLSWQEQAATLGTGGSYLPRPLLERLQNQQMVAASTRGWGTRQLQQVPENPLCQSWTQQVCWEEPFLLPDEAGVWFFVHCDGVMGEERGGACFLPNSPLCL